MLERLIATVVALAAMTNFATTADSVVLYAAGSLRPLLPLLPISRTNSAVDEAAEPRRRE
jgi:hypothetical protein